jgi:hypothetical protein
MLALLGITCALATSVGAQAFDYRKAAQDAARELEVQQSLPNDSGLADSAKSGKPISSSSRGLGGEAPGAGAVLAQLKWPAIGGLAVLAGFLIASQIRDRRANARLTPLAVGAAPEVEPARVTASPEQWLADAETHAAAGRFRDAMHCVTLAAMGHVARRFRAGAPDSATSWELLRAAELKDIERSALRDLLTRTDRAWFGEYASGVDDYEAARRCFQSFLASENA